MTTLFLNGEFVPANAAVVSVFDRGFLYGDGMFETLLMWNGKPFEWQAHWTRLERAARTLELRVPASSAELQAVAQRLTELNQMPRGVLRLTVSRGVGPRGYSIRQTGPPTLVMSLHPLPFENPIAPASWKLRIAPFRFWSGDPLAGLKSANQLGHILARHAAESAGAEEALLLDERGHVIEGSSANLFWIEDGRLFTPPLSAGALPGVTRAVVRELCGDRGWEVNDRSAPPETLEKAEGVFLTFSSQGIVEAVSLESRPLTRSAWVKELFEAYWRRVYARCALG